MIQRDQAMVAVPAFRARPARARALWNLAVRKPLGAAALLVILLMWAMALFAPLVSPYDPIQVQKGRGGLSLKPPMTQGAVLPDGRQGPPFILGTDDKARDILSRLIWGSRVSLTVGIIAVVLGTLSGSLVGLISGFFEGKTDMVIQRIVDGLMAFPGIILALSIVAVLGPSTVNTFLAISVIIAPNASRVVRGGVLSVKQNMYIEAARAMGATNLRIMFQHISPNITAPVIILASVTLGNAILLESSLSFLGLGTPLPEPSWGNMIGGVAARARLEDAPWMGIVPGVAISLAVYAFNLFGDAIRDVLDPRLRGR